MSDSTIHFIVGRPELRPFIVAVRRNYYWPPEYYDALVAARAAYCAGTHEMCQGRDGDVIIQYLIPRKERVEKRPFYRPGRIKREPLDDVLDHIADLASEVLA